MQARIRVGALIVSTTSLWSSKNKRSSVKHERRIRRDIKALEAEMERINQQGLSGKVESQLLSQLEAQRSKLYAALLKPEK